MMVLAISVAYLKFGGLPWMRGAFYGIGAAVIAVIANSAWRLTRRTVNGDRLLWSIVIVNAVVTAWTQAESVWLVAGSGVLVIVLRAPSRTNVALSLAACNCSFLARRCGAADALAERTAIS